MPINKKNEKSETSIRLFDKTTLKFILVGIINTLFGTGVMFLAYNVFSASYWLSSALNYILGSILSYFLNKYFTFQSKEKSWSQVVKFILNITVCYFLAYGLAKPLVMRILSGQEIKLVENVAMVVGMVLFVGLNYLGQRFLVFSEKK
ncbi:GtrA family protein [Kallipyga massiliensis]|uniref:GtrA family protein n=1 Tax=Kallipyga massiliensis TaxID=1472764 RepID=UPI0026EF8A6D|nr:GtrA family protein [Kallipyga massiliensis]